MTYEIALATIEQALPFIPGVPHLPQVSVLQNAPFAGEFNLSEAVERRRAATTNGAAKHTSVEPIRPFVKWVGGKRQLLDVLNAAAPVASRLLAGSRYFEPFIGGGALLFSRLPGIATISDINPELVNCYQIIKDDVDGLIRSLRTQKNTEEHFYKVRAKAPSSMTPVQRASRFIYLNKTCFNGLYRENKSGQFNAPYGRYANPSIVDEPNLRAISSYLNANC